MSNFKKPLYRDPKNGKLGGVCAGIAEYFAVEVWIIRLLAISAFLFSGGFLVILAYIAAYFLLSEMPEQREWQQSIYKKQHVKQKAWQSGQSAQQILENINQQLNSIENDIEQMEAYVTSFAFKMDDQLNKH